MDRKSKKNLQRVLYEEVDTVLFDLDGTLIDSSKDIALCANYALKKLGFEPLEEEEIIKHVGYGGENLIKGIIPIKDPEVIAQAVNLFRQHYYSNPVVYTQPFEYIPDILKILKDKGKKLAVITNKYEDISKQILKRLNLYNFFDFIAGGDTFKSKKPDPEPIKKTLEILNAQNSIIIGDSEADINAGKNAGIKTCLVMYGFGKEEKIRELRPDFKIEKPKDLYEVLS